MTVWENLIVVAPGGQGSRGAVADRAEELLRRMSLLELREHLASELSFGQQRLLEMARALMLDPRLLLLDEPFAGVNPTMAQTIQQLLRGLRDEGRTIFLIDHAMAVVMGLCERLLVMDMGEVIADGPPATIQANAKVLEAYFGRPATQVESAR
jgi:branched-chain amino acid transport system ATP-binding protein